MKCFYPKFALDAVRKNRKSYLPYLFTIAFTAAMYDILRSLSLSELFAGTFGGNDIAFVLSLGSIVIAVFSVIFLFYTGSFLIKQRKKEFGLYSVLGMERRHIARILFWETLLMAVAGLIFGLLVGALLNWAAFLLLLNMLGGDPNAPFSLSFQAMGETVLIFSGIFLLIYLNNLRQIWFSSASSLLKSDQEGEREPRSKWPLTVLGLLCLGAGYYLAVTIKNPMGAFLLFFVAVILVMIGTYCLFVSGSIVLLKFLRRRKNYYYKTNHFISVSGMLYRMKQNAVSLGNICILSTMVLVTVSSTMSLYTGCEEMLFSRYPRELNLTVYSDQQTPETNRVAFALLDKMIAEEKALPENQVKLTYLSFGGVRDGDKIITNQEGVDLVGEMTSLVYVTLIPAGEYTRLTGETPPLSDDALLLYNRDGFSYDRLTLLGKTYTVEETLKDYPYTDILLAHAYPTLILTVTDGEFERLYRSQKAEYGDNASQIVSYYGVDMADKEAAARIRSAFDGKMRSQMDHAELAELGEQYGFWFFTLDSREENRSGYFQLYAGLFFIGIFLGLLFLAATILIIYYKQLSEGLQDKKRFTIMRQVGLTDREIRASIHSQILTMFFLPLLTAFLHTAFAFPMVKRILDVLSMSDTKTFLLCLALCCGVFALVYLAVYLLTSRVYYRLVNS